MMTEGAEQKVQPSAVEHVEVTVAILLRVGVLVSSAIMVIGLALLFFTPSNQNFSHLKAPVNMVSLIRGISTCQPAAIIQAGLLVLILTPVMRVVSAAIIYTIEGDRDYAVITGFVLTVLLLGMFLGRVG